MTDIVLPFPPASLSGHTSGHWRAKASVTAKYRAWAFQATLAAKIGPLPAEGDIRILIAFYPPDRRSDRLNFFNRCKPYFDGIAEALGVNDKRFLPSLLFGEPEIPGRVVVVVDPRQ